MRPSASNGDRVSSLRPGDPMTSWVRRRRHAWLASVTADNGVWIRASLWGLLRSPVTRRMLLVAATSLLICGCAVGARASAETWTSVPSPRPSASVSGAATASVTPAPAHGTFSSVGSEIGNLTGPAALLPDGRVLVVQACGYGDTTGAAGLYDPAKGTYTLTASMNTPRMCETVTPLKDGEVLVAGGYDNEGNVLASAELYDTGKGMFTPTGSMHTARVEQTATLLGDGRVLITGGLDDSAGELRTAELYDPATGRFSPTGSMKTPRVDATATVLAGGHVLIAGGDDGNQQLEPGDYYASSELYDPVNGKFTTTGSLTAPRSHGAAVRLDDGRVLVVGGSNGTASLTFAETYDSATGKFTRTVSMSRARLDPTVTLLGNGQVLVAGGNDDVLVQPLMSADLFDPTTNVFTPTGSMLPPMPAQSAVLLDDGSVLLVGNPTDIYWP